MIPLFLAITRGDSAEKQRRTALKASVVTVVMLRVFAATGDFIFRLFGITLGAFKIAAGLLTFQVSLDMLRAQLSRVRSSPEEESEPELLVNHARHLRKDVRGVDDAEVGRDSGRTRSGQ